jgi:hypothetical protein
VPLKILPKVAAAFGEVNRGEAAYTLSELYGYKIHVHDFDGFAILTKLNKEMGYTHNVVTVSKTPAPVLETHSDTSQILYQMVSKG